MDYSNEELLEMALSGEDISSVYDGDFLDLIEYG